MASNKVDIYILKLVENKYYVGRSKPENLFIRLKEHFEGGENASSWTTIYKPIEILEVLKNCDPFDEDKYTLKYMQTYGIRNVRGGSFSKINLGDDLHRTILIQLRNANNLCINCGKPDHFKKFCRITSGFESPKPSKRPLEIEYLIKENDTVSSNNRNIRDEDLNVCPTNFSQDINFQQVISNEICVCSCCLDLISDLSQHPFCYDDNCCRSNVKKKHHLDRSNIQPSYESRNQPVVPNVIGIQLQDSNDSDENFVLLDLIFPD